MALQKTITITDAYGDEKTFSDAYIRVDAIGGKKDQMIATIRFYKKQGEALVFKEISEIFVPDLDGSNFIKQAYEHLRALPEFAGAADV
jgi:hypothetical protein